MGSGEGCGVVVPLRDGARWIGAALASVLAQTRPPAEIVVVDDGSSDGSAALAEAIPGVTVLRRPHRGLSAARNSGIERIESALVAFLDQDDLWSPEHLERAQAALARTPRAPAAVSSTRDFRDGDAPALGAIVGGPAVYDPWTHFPLGNRVHTPSAVVARRGAVLRAGGFRPEYDGAEDIDLWLRLALAEPFARIDAETVGRRLHSTSHLRGLVAADPIDRLERRARAVEDAGRRRFAEARDDGERDVLMRRIALAHGVTELARAALAGDAAAIRAAAVAVESGLDGESPERRRDIARFLETSLGLAVERAHSASAIFGALERNWPQGAHAAVTRAGFAERRSRGSR